VTDDPPASKRRRVARGEGEVTQWPRGLTSYVPSGPADTPPSPDEDRLANRLDLAAKLLGVLRSQGTPVDVRLAELRAAEEAFRSGDRALASRRVEQMFAALGESSPAGPSP
jgi:hypothetical protein